MGIKHIRAKRTRRAGIRPPKDESTDVDVEDWPIDEPKPKDNTNPEERLRRWMAMKYAANFLYATDVATLAFWLVNCG